MTPAQAAAFRERGWLFLSAALPADLVQAVRSGIHAALKRQDIWAGGRTLGNRIKDLPTFQQVGKLGQALHQAGLRDRLMTPALVATMRELAGAPLVPEPDMQLLVTLPGKEPWTLAGLNWHRDLAHSPSALVPGVQAFVLVDDVEPHGGGTLVLEGSHLVKGRVEAPPGAAANGTLRIADRELPIVEMKGRAGDVYLMDLRLVHTPSHNASKRVRMMATVRYRRP